MYENICSDCMFFAGLPIQGKYADYDWRECPKGGRVFGANPLKGSCTSYRNSDDFGSFGGLGKMKRSTASGKKDAV
jgi:hypothetical protein